MSLYRKGQLEAILENARKRGLVVSDTPARTPQGLAETGVGAILTPKTTPDPPPGGAGAKKKGKRRREMNGIETEFSRILEAKLRRGEIYSFEYEGIMLRWADGMKYSPDFVVHEDRGDLGGGRLYRVTLIEIKGAYAWQKDIVKYRAARDKWGDRYAFEFWQKVDGEWQETR